MAITYQEAVSRLLAGEKLAWQKHSGHTAGEIVLSSPSARRLLHFLLEQDSRAVSTADEVLFPDLIAAWDNEDHDPKNEQVSAVEFSGDIGFRLEEIETKGFGGVNQFLGSPFVLNVGGQSWCLEGQNGSGKTSLLSTIIWCLTGCRISEYLGLLNDEGRRDPVFDKDGRTLGTWPPIAAYPTNIADLREDARVGVKLVFRNQSGEEALAERIIVSKADGTVTTERAFVDARLCTVPQLLESGLLMPCRMAHINFGDKSQTLYEAVKALTGLDRLGAIGDGAANLTHGGRRFLKYEKDKGIAQIERDYNHHFSRATEVAAQVELDITNINSISTNNIIEQLNERISYISKTAGEHSEKLDTLTPDDIDASKPEGRQKVFDAIGVAKDIAKHATEKVKTFSFLKALHKAHEDGVLKDLATVLTSAETELVIALEWHTLQQQDQKLRLKAIASLWYEDPPSPGQIAVCPLCLADLETTDQKHLQDELRKLKAAGHKAERKLDDVCRSIREELTEALPEDLLLDIDIMIAIEPKSDITSGATELFTSQPPFSDVLTGTATVLKQLIAEKAQPLEAFIASSDYAPPSSEPASATSVRKYLYAIRRTLELAEWWVGHRTAFAEFWRETVGAPSEKESRDERTLLRQVAVIEEALAASQPYDTVLASLSELLKLAIAWQQIKMEQRKREEISEALKPLKDLRTFVDSETARSISDLSDRMKSFADRIHLKERLDFDNADLQKKEVHITGSFTDGMAIDALPIANTSWLKAMLWAFIFCLREKTIEAYGGNPFPLVILDDPQTTFDPRNKRKWAQELVRIANLDEDDENSAQLLLTTHERQFFTFITELERLKGQQGLIAPVDDVSGHLTVVSGDVLEREYRSAKDNNDDARARSYIRQIRIYVEKLLKHMLRGEGPHVEGSNLERLRKDLRELNLSHTAPFNRRPFTDLLVTISGGERPVILINNPPHDDDETTGLAEAEDVHEFWEKTLRKRLHKAFHAFAAFEAHFGDPRVFDYPENVVTLPVGQSIAIAKAPLFQTGLAAAAATDGRVGDGVLRLEEWEQAEKVVLFNHEIYRLTANTLDPVATIGNMVIVSNYAIDIAPKRLVVAAVEDRLLARRFQVSDLHPDLAVLTAQAVNPYEIAPPVIAPRKDIEIKKIVGTLFTTNGGAVSPNEIEAVGDPKAFLPYLENARLFRVQGRSAEPIALEDQFLLVGKPRHDPKDWGSLDGRLVIAIDAEGASYFKRLRAPRAGLYVLESLNPDGTTAAELLSVDGRDGIPQLAKVLPVLGVLFELPASG